MNSPASAGTQLGVLLASRLHLDHQLAAAAGVGGGLAQLQQAHELQPSSSQSEMATTIHALITLRLDYC